MAREARYQGQSWSPRDGQWTFPTIGIRLKGFKMRSCYYLAQGEDVNMI
jgi:hypothetical protein